MGHQPTQSKSLSLAPKICLCVCNSLTDFGSVLGRVLACGSSWSGLRGASILPSWQAPKSIPPALLAGRGGLVCCAERRHLLCQGFGRTGVGNGSGWLHLLSVSFNYLPTVCLALINGDCVSCCLGRAGPIKPVIIATN